MVTSAMVVVVVMMMMTTMPLQAPGGDIMVMLKPRLHAQWEEPREIVTQPSSSPPFQLAGKPVGSSSTLVLPFWTEHLSGSPV